MNTQNKNNLVVLTLEKFPNGDASSNRLLSLLKTFEECGYNPLVIGNGVAIDHQKTSWQTIENSCIKYKSIRSKKDSFLNKFLTRILSTFIFYNELVKIDKSTIKAILTTHTTISPGIIFLARYIFRTPIITECSEWHEKKQYSGPLSLINFASFLFKFHVLCPLTGNVICISEYLAKKFSFKCNTIVVPPTIDSNEFDQNINISTSKTHLEIFYGGSINGKDDIATVAKGILLLEKNQREKIKFTIAGPSPSALKAYFEASGIKYSEIENIINPIGRISKSDTVSRLSKSDFSILIRPVSRYSMAGFPSKLVESLASGTPIITNLTSDIGKYIEDGIQSIIVKECSKYAVANALRKALLLDENSITQYKINSKKTAIEKFHFTRFTEEIKNFIRFMKI